MATPRHDIAEAICTLALDHFESGAELVVDKDISPYDYERTGPQTARVRTQGRTFRIHVRSER